MPGVPPDALAQVKKGFKSLFNRKKKERKDSAPASTMTPTTNTAVTDTPNLSQDAAADMAPTNAAKEHPAIGQPAGTDPMQKTLTEERAAPGVAALEKHDKIPGTKSSGTPQISEPANVSESKNIDLNLSSTLSVSKAAEPDAMKSTSQPLPPTDATEAAKFEPKPLVEGMSATSGPLSDDLSGDYGGAQVEPVMAEDEAKGNFIQEAGKK